MGEDKATRPRGDAEGGVLDKGLAGPVGSTGSHRGAKHGGRESKRRIPRRGAIVAETAAGCKSLDL